MADAKLKTSYLEGSVADKVIMFALPLAATGILQQLFNAADTIVVGRFSTREAMAAVGSNGPVMGLLVNLLLGLSLGANVVISQNIGRRDYESVRRSVHTAIITALACGAAICCIGELLVGFMMDIMSVPDNVRPYSVVYLRILLLGVPFNMLYNFESAIMRSAGNTRTPLMALFGSGILNVGLNLLFVVVLGRNADGVAIGTVISHIASSVFLLIYLIRSDSIVRVRVSELRVDTKILGKIIKIGLPAGLQQSMFSVANLILQTSINTLGSTVMAGTSAAHSLELVAYFVLNAFGQACVTFVGQNYGARNYKRCRLIVKRIFQVGIAMTLAVSAIMVLAADPLVRLFNDDPAVIAAGVTRLRIIVAFEFLEAIVNLFSGACRGYGHSMWPAVFAVFGICGVRIIWALTVFPVFHTLGVLLIAYPVSWAVNGLLVAVYYFALIGRLDSKRVTTRRTAGG